MLALRRMHLIPRSLCPRVEAAWGEMEGCLGRHGRQGEERLGAEAPPALDSVRARDGLHPLCRCLHGCGSGRMRAMNDRAIAPGGASAFRPRFLPVSCPGNAPGGAGTAAQGQYAYQPSASQRIVTALPVPARGRDQSSAMHPSHASKPCIQAMHPSHAPTAGVHEEAIIEGSPSAELFVGAVVLLIAASKTRIARHEGHSSRLQSAGRSSIASVTRWA
jgi:hypothetical protein